MSSITSILHGSCHANTYHCPFWDTVGISYNPDIFVFGGDNIYADNLIADLFSIPPVYKFEKTNVENLDRQYNMLNSIPAYKNLWNNGKTNVVATWDDHDYGLNDADRTFSLIEESKAAFMKAFHEPSHSPRYKHNGVYHAHYFDYGKVSDKEYHEDRTVGVVLLDVRTFKDPWKTTPAEEGDMLGEQQWIWLESVLCDNDGYVDGLSGNVIKPKSKPRVTFIVTGLQVLIDNRYVGEYWAKFPNARQRLFNLLYKCKVRAPILLSGDVHMAELSIATCNENENIVVEFTSSGMTHSWGTRFASWVGMYTVPNILGAWLLNLAQLVFPYNYRSREAGREYGYYLGLNLGEYLIDWEKGTFDGRILDERMQPALRQVWSLDQLDIKNKDNKSELKCLPIDGVPSKPRLALAVVLIVFNFVFPLLALIFYPIFWINFILKVVLNKCCKKSKR